MRLTGLLCLIALTAQEDNQEADLPVCGHPACHPDICWITDTAPDKQELMDWMEHADGKQIQNYVLETMAEPAVQLQIAEQTDRIIDYISSLIETNPSTISLIIDELNHITLTDNPIQNMIMIITISRQAVADRFRAIVLSNLYGGIAPDLLLSVVPVRIADHRPGQEDTYD